MGPLNHQCVHHVYHCAFLISSLRSPHSSCRPRSSRSLAVSTKTFTTFFASFREDANVTFINTTITLTTSSNRFKGARCTATSVHSNQRSQQPAFPATSVHSNQRTPTSVHSVHQPLYSEQQSLQAQRLLRLFH